MEITKLGKYELHGQLGRGGFGTVYRATDTVLGRDVALKILHPQLTVDADFIERFRNEARKIAAFDHPNIATVYDMGEESGRVFIAMRYLPGKSLRDMLQKAGPLTFEQALQITKEVSAGLKAANAKGLIHRDIKPENILFTEDGQAVIGDFGLAKAIQSSSSSSSSSIGGIGTPAYRAPELWRGKPPASPATDEYSLACVFTEMLTGKQLFIGDTPDEIITQHLVDGAVLPEKWPSVVPDGIDNILEKALDKDPAKRYGDANTLVETIENVLGKSVGQLAASKTASPTSRPAKHTPRPKARAKRHLISERVTSPIDETMVRKKESKLSKPEEIATRPPSWSNPMVWVAGFAVLVFIIGAITNQRQQQLIPADIEPPGITSYTITSSPLSKPALVATVMPTHVTIIPTATLSAIIDAKGVNMVLVPEGDFIMGSDAGDPDEKPVHQVYLDTYYIDRYEVTNVDYETCVKASVCELPKYTSSKTRSIYYGNSKYDNYPVIYVDWNMAKVYCEWRGGELPTEAQWEKAARGTDGRIYSWGANIDKTYANYNFTVGDTTAVGSYELGKSPYGAYDMMGNVWEWVADWYDKNYYLNSPNANPKGPDTGLYRVLRGGTWNGITIHVESSFRYEIDPTAVGNNIGFRCFRSVP